MSSSPPPTTPSKTVSSPDTEMSSEERQPTSYATYAFIAISLVTIGLQNIRSYKLWHNLRARRGMPKAPSTKNSKGFLYWHIKSRFMLVDNGLKQISRNMKEQGPRGLIRAMIDNMRHATRLKTKIFEHALDLEASTMQAVKVGKSVHAEKGRTLHKQTKKSRRKS